MRDNIKYPDIRREKNTDEVAVDLIFNNSINHAIDANRYSYVKNISACVFDMTDKVICKAIVKEAEENGISDLYMLDKKFVSEALKKQIALKVISIPYKYGQHFHCPACDYYLGWEYEQDKHYCMKCGQALDWSDTK